MAITFPASPSTNDIFTEGSITYKYDGVKWVGVGLTPVDRLVEGSNKLEIDSNNHLIWTGGDVGLGSSTINQQSGGRTVLSIDGTNNALLNFNHSDTLAGFMYGANDEFRMESNGTRPLIFRGNSETRLTIKSTGEQESFADYTSSATNTFASWARTGGAIRAEVGYNAVTLDYMYFGTGTLHPLALRTNNNTALFIDNSQKVLIGGITSIEPDGYSNTLQVHGDDVSAGISILRYSDDDASPTLLFGKSRGATIGTDVKVQSGDQLGKIEFYGIDGNYEGAASIRACADGEWWSGSAGSEDNTDAPGRLEFHTTPNGLADLRERMRIDSGGQLIIGSNNTEAYHNSIISVSTTTSKLLELRASGSGTTDTNYVKRWAQSFVRGTNESTHDILTLGAVNGNSHVVIELKMYCVAAVDNQAGIITAYANAEQDSPGTYNYGQQTPTINFIIGTGIAVGSLGWSGSTLQYTTDANHNYVKYNCEITVWAHDRMSITFP